MLRLHTYNPDSDPTGIIEQIWVGSAPEIAVPYSVSQWSPFKKMWLMQLESVESRDDASKLVRGSVWVPRSLFDDDGWYMDDLVGAPVIVRQPAGEGGEKIGTIEAFADNGGQTLLQIHRGNRSIYIPWVDAFVSGVEEFEGQPCIVLTADAPIDLA